MIQRLDGFVSIDSPYEKEVEMVTKPFTFDGDLVVGYINGVPIDSTGGCVLGPQSMASLMIGGLNYGERSNATFDEVSIWDYAITNEEIFDFKDLLFDPLFKDIYLFSILIFYLYF